MGDKRILPIQGPVYIAPLSPVGIAAYHLLLDAGVQVLGFCDRDTAVWNKQYDGCKVTSYQDAVADLPDKAVFLVSSLQYTGEIAAQLQAMVPNRVWLLEELFKDMAPAQMEVLLHTACQKIDHSQMAELGRTLDFSQHLAGLMIKEYSRKYGFCRTVQAVKKIAQLDLMLITDVDFLAHCFYEMMQGYVSLERLYIHGNYLPWDGNRSVNECRQLEDLLGRLVSSGIKIETCHIVGTDLLNWLAAGRFMQIVGLLYKTADEILLLNAPRLLSEDEYQKIDKVKDAFCDWKNTNIYRLGDRAQNFYRRLNRESNIHLSTEFFLRASYAANPYLFLPNETDNHCIHIHTGSAASKGVSLHLFNSFYSHGAQIKDYELEDPERTKRYFKFAIVRNPWDRVLSIYRRNRKHWLETGFDQYQISYGKPAKIDYIGQYATLDNALQHLSNRPRLSYGLLNTQYERLAYSDGMLGIDYTGRFENLEESVAYIAEKIGKEHLLGRAVAQGVATTQTGRSYKDEYNNESRLLVEELYQKDIECFGYRF